MESFKKNIEIQPKGSYLSLDAEGYVINPASIEKIGEPWRLVVDDAVEAYRKSYGDELRCVYVRGSVAKGEAIEGVSDVDTFAYVNLPKEEIDDEWTQGAEEKFSERYSYAQGVELDVRSTQDADRDSIMLNQSVCVWGDAVSVPRIKPGKAMALHAPNFHKRLESFTVNLEKEQGESEIRAECVWLMKGLLRVGFEITMERSHTYTRDLYPCYETFSKYYPEKEPEMRRVLHLALNPTADKETLREIMDTFGRWLQEEADKQFN